MLSESSTSGEPKLAQTISCLTSAFNVFRGNQLTKCLEFSPPLCEESNAWSEGGQAVGSMLTLADLSDNFIFELEDLSRHRFLECLLLSNNKIRTIGGLGGLKYLQVSSILLVCHWLMF
jgi:hypothetical protein